MVLYSAGCLGVAVVVRCASDDGDVVDDEITTVVARGEEANCSEARWLLQAMSSAAMVDFPTSAGAEVVASGSDGVEQGCERWLRVVCRLFT